MLTYTFSRREKALLLFMAIILVAIVWFVFVYQRTTNELNSLENEIAAVQSETAVASAQVNRMHAMQAVIAKYKSEGVDPVPMPDYDNMTPLMSELNRIMAVTYTYTISFDGLDTTATDYVLRGVTINYSCDSYETAEAVIAALANGEFPCSIDSVSISNNGVRTVSRVTGYTGSGTVSASVHVTFFEKKV